MRTWSTGCPDWSARILDGRSLIACDPLFPDEAEAALAVFQSLRVVDVPGRPTFGEIGAEWMFDFVRAVFGAYDCASGKRLIQQFFLCISKKNGKSTLAAGIMLTALIRNWRHSAELLLLAPTIEAANNAYAPAREMVRADDELTDLLHPRDNMRMITHRGNGASLKVLSADSDVVGGKKASFVFVDELWAFGKRSSADAMFQEATGGLVSRPEGAVIWATTQSDAPPAGVFKAKLQYARDVRDGVVADPKFLPVVYEYPPALVKKQAYLMPENWHVTNPNIDRSVSREWLGDKLREAERDGEGSLRTFLAKHLNVEIGQSLRGDRWAGAEFWERRADAAITLDYLFERCDIIVPGIDGGGLDDLFGLCLLGREKHSRDWLAWSHAWAHRGVLERRKSIASVLLDFEKAGELTIVDDELQDISSIVEIIADVKDRGRLGPVSVDPAGLGEFVDALAEIGLTPEAGDVLGAPQGWAMMNSVKTAERKLANGTIRHAGSSLMAWSVANLKIEATATGIRATKQNAGDAKIDPVMALFNSVTAMARNPAAKRKPTYKMLVVG